MVRGPLEPLELLQQQQQQQLNHHQLHAMHKTPQNAQDSQESSIDGARASTTRMRVAALQADACYGRLLDRHSTFLAMTRPGRSHASDLIAAMDRQKRRAGILVDAAAHWDI